MNGGGEEKLLQFPVISPLKSNEMDEKIKVYFIDNASMISDVNSNNNKYIFGSGKLLSDIIRYVNIHESKNKIIFIGDTSLIHPVNMNNSPALDKEYIKSNFDTIPYEYELKEKINNNAGIIKLSETLYSSIKHNDFNTLQIKNNNEDVRILDENTFINKFLELKSSYKFSQEIIITSSNKTARDYNKKIKEKMGKNIHQLTIQDKLVVLKTEKINDILIASGEFVYIKEIEDQPLIIHEEIDNKQYTLMLRKANLEYFINKLQPILLENVYLHELLLDIDDDDLTIEEEKAVSQYIKTHNDKILNTLKVKYGYAITAHKAQDSKWKNVFIDCETYHNNKMTRDYFQWVYTAITRSFCNIYLTNVPNIILGIDNNTINIENTDYDYEELGSILIEMIRTTIIEVKNYQILISNIYQNLYILKFINNNIITELKIYYKKDLYISSIQTTDNSEQSIKIKGYLNAIKNKKIDKNYNNIPKLNNEIFDNMIENIVNSLKEHNLHTEVKLLQWTIRFIIHDNMEQAILDIIYNKKNIITDRRFLPNSNQTIINKIRSILGI